jgi:acyl-CoA thioester hydrolase
VTREVRFREVDVMGFVWFGHYVGLIEEASTALLRRCALGYDEFVDAAMMSPVLELHVDYKLPLYLGETVTVKASLVWTEAARLNLEFVMHKEDGRVAATAYTVQIFVDAATEEPCFAPPPLLENLRTRWKNGEFRDLQPA